MHSLLEKFESLQVILMQLPVLVYVFVGTIIEEIVSPIPSPIILTSAGFLTDSQGKGFLFLFLVALAGTIGKILGTLIYYFAGLKGEEFLDKKIAKVLGLSNLDVEKYGEFFEGNKKGILLFLLFRILPIFPSTPVSLVSGMIQMDFKKFLSLSFIGIYFRNLSLLFLGYFSYENMGNVLDIIENIEGRMTEALILGVMLAFGAYAYKNKAKIEDFLLKKLKKSKDN